MGNFSHNPNSNSTNFCLSLLPLSKCTAKNQENPRNSQSFDDRSPAKPNSFDTTKPTHYSPLVISQSFFTYKEPKPRNFSNFSQENAKDCEFPLHFKSCPENGRINPEKLEENGQLPDTNAEKLKEILSEAVKTMQKTGKKALKIALNGRVSAQAMAQLHETLNKCRPLKFLRLDLEATGLRDAEILMLSRCLETLVDVEGLEILLQKNHITYISGKALIKSLEKIRNLKVFSINLSYNIELSGNALEELAEEIGNFEKIEEICFELQAIRLNTSDLFFIELLNSLSRCKLLRVLHLNLSENMLKSNILNFFLNGMKNFAANLREFQLLLNQNPLNSPDLYELSNLLEEARELHAVSLGFKECRLHCEALEIILIVLSKNPRISKISLNFNGNDLRNKQQVARFLVDYINPEVSFAKMQDFRLDLSFCLLDRTIFENLAFVLHCMRKVQRISLVFRAVLFKNKGFEQIVCSLANFSKLCALKLDFKGADISRENFEVLLVGVKNLKHLQILKVNLAKTFEFNAKELENICGFAVNLWSLREFRVKTKGKKKIFEALASFIEERAKLLSLAYKFRGLHKDLRMRVFSKILKLDFFSK